jgi:Transcriptional activator TraM
MSGGPFVGDIDGALANQVTEEKTDWSDDGMDAIIRTVAVKHGIALGKNDPILVLDTMNGLLINQFAKRQDVLIKEFHTKLETAADLWNKNMENKAKEMLCSMETSHRHLIGELIERHIEALAREIADKSGDISIGHQKKAVTHLRGLTNQIKVMRFMLNVNFAASILALMSGIVMLCLLYKS